MPLSLRRVKRTLTPNALGQRARVEVGLWDGRPTFAETPWSMGYGNAIVWYRQRDYRGPSNDLRAGCMDTFADNEAAKPNPLLQALNILVGTWTTTGTHPLAPGKTLHGRTTFGWIERGAFLAMHSQIDEPEIPSAIAIFGTDDATGECSMLYFDERNVSRRYETRLEGTEWRWWRNASDFSQRFVGTISADGRTMVCRGEYSRDGGPWEPDLVLTYRRVEA